jgi:shikimate 5-dehydrogenase
VNDGRRVVADNTDVDGFSAILAQLCGRDRKSVAVLGAGGTARAALVAVQRAGMHASVFNRSTRPFPIAVQPLAELARFDGEIIIDTLPGDVTVDVPLRPGMAYIEAAYGHERVRDLAGIQYFNGLELLQAQALRQNDLFMKALA